MPFAARSDCEQSALHVHYVAPSFWAWKGGEARLKGLCEFVDHLLCILPFEEEVCRANGLPATYVGHPMLEDHVHLNEVDSLPFKYLADFSIIWLVWYLWKSLLKICKTGEH